MRPAKWVRPGHSVNDAPPRFVEYVFYLFLLYNMFGPVLGLSINFLGAAMLAVMAAFCTLRLGSRALIVYRALLFPLGCAFLTVVIQVFLHEESVMGSDYLRPFIPWILTLIIMQALSLDPGFLHRFAPTSFCIGLLTLPYLTFWGKGNDVQRAALEEGVAYSNPNALGAWFGFCSVYFVIAGMQTRRTGIRIASWLLFIGCLYIIGLTVSRSALLAALIATVIALRRLLKRSFLPVLFFFMFGWIAYESGLFERIIASYATRGAEDTGRFSLWAVGLDRFLDSPLIGVGASHVQIWLPNHTRPLDPHNAFLFVALGSGIIPLVFFVAYWIQSTRAAFRSYAEHLPDAPFRIPLLAYAFLISFAGNAVFMYPWMIATHSTAIAQDFPPRVRWARYPGRWGKIRYATDRLRIRRLEES